MLRKEYPNYSLVHFIPLTLWKETLEQIGTADPDSYIRIFSAGNFDLADLNHPEEEIVRLVRKNYEIEIENRF